MLSRLMADRWISGASSLGLAAGLMLGYAGLAFADGGHGGGHAGGGHVGGVGYVGGRSMSSNHHTGAVGGMHHNGGSTHHYGGYAGYSGIGIDGLGGYGLGGNGLGGYGLGYSGFGNYGSPYGYAYGSGYGSGIGYSNYYYARPSTYYPPAYYPPAYSPSYITPQYPMLRPGQYTVMPSSTVASRKFSPQSSSNVYSGPVSADGQPVGDLRPGMVLPDGAIVVSVGSSAK